MKNAIKFGFGFYLGKFLFDFVAGVSVHYALRLLKDHETDAYRKAAAEMPETYERLIKKYPDLAI